MRFWNNLHQAQNRKIGKPNNLRHVILPHTKMSLIDCGVAIMFWLLVYLSTETFKLFGVPICWLWAYMMRVIPETSYAHWNKYLRLYSQGASIKKIKIHAIWMGKLGTCLPKPSNGKFTVISFITPFCCKISDDANTSTIVRFDLTWNQPTIYSIHGVLAYNI